jgi:site-specific DNA-methyltransferase (adenine-specific)
MPRKSAGVLDLPLGNAVLLGDARKAVPRLPDDYFRCLLTDPPYGIAYVSDWNNGANARPIQGDCSGAHQLLEEVLRLSRPKLRRDAAVYVFSSWKTLPKTLEVVSEHFKVKNVLVWVKDSWSMGDLRSAYAGQHELIVYAVKGRLGLKPPRSPDVLSYPRVPPMLRLHPAQKPVELLEFLVEKSTEEGEAVLDPFAGSGSTAIACLRTGRRFTCVEKSLKHFSASVERITGHLKGGEV